MAAQKGQYNQARFRLILEDNVQIISLLAQIFVIQE